VEWQGEKYRTAIFKAPVYGRVTVRSLGLQGDSQADLRVHGGPQKAVYAYPSEHYQFWKEKLKRELPWGMFGENVTTQGLLEGKVHVGDRIEAGSAEFIITTPRFPCYKLGIKFGNMDMVKRFQESRMSGFYMAVLKEGEIEAGDQMRIVESGEGPTIAQVFVSED